MANVYTTAQRFRKALLERDESARARMVTAYDDIRKRLDVLLVDITRQIEAARKNGEIVNQAWLYQQTRYRQLIFQAEAEINRWALDTVAPIITTEQQRIIALAQSQSAELIALQSPSIAVNFASLPTEAITNLVGFAGDGSPLATLLGRYGAASADLIRTTLINGLATGKGSRQTAREIRRIIDIPRWQAERLSRTELLRSFREATRQTYVENGVKRWMWLSAKSTRTCSACLSLDGTIFSTATKMASHVNCRCVLVGLVGTPRQRQTGAEWFAQQSADVQDGILGKSGGEKYRSGEAKLSDFVGLKKSRKWGNSYVQISPR